MRRSLVAKEEERMAFRPFGENAASSRLGLRFADGAARSLPYRYLVETHFDPSLGIVLSFVGHRVTIIGRNLEQGYEALEDETVGEITERHAEDFTLPEGACYIERIVIEAI